MQMSGTDKYFFTILHVCYILIKVLQRSKMASASLYQKKFLSEKWVWERDVIGFKMRSLLFIKLTIVRYKISKTIIWTL